MYVFIMLGGKNSSLLTLRTDKSEGKGSEECGLIDGGLYLFILEISKTLPPLQARMRAVG